MRVPLCPPAWARLETLRMDKWTWAQKPGSGATQAGTQAGQAQHTTHLILGTPSCGLVLTGPPCIGGGHGTVQGPVMRNPLEQRSTAKTAREPG